MLPIADGKEHVPMAEILISLYARISKPRPSGGNLYANFSTLCANRQLRETQGRISLSSFVGVYLRLLHFPADLIVALESGQLNLQEATLLARLTAERLATMPRQAKALRQSVLKAHLQANGSQNSLRARVQSLLGETAAVVSSKTMTEAVQKVDELLEIGPEDVRHLFFEEIRNLFYALKEIEPAEVTEDDIAHFSQAADQVFNVIQGIRQQRKHQALPRPFQL